ncbi:MAG TPA: hypothetical protein VHG51_09355 [Longimicrobiaceae bacterium]|nr:hypothetical protein [Longimicrobiaceae bacterium]
MVKLGSTKSEDPSRAGGYFRVAQGLRSTARDLGTMADPKYGNGLAIVAIHAAIAYADALTVAYGGFKSTDGDHTRASDALQRALGHRADARQVRRLSAILDAKSHASYSGSYYTLADAQRILEDLEVFAGWAEEVYRSRPPA